MTTSPTMKVFANVAAMEAAVGSHLGYSEWRTVTQQQINAFADSTGDDQWIHVDPVKAAQGPFGTTIAHGYLTLSLVPLLVSEVYRVDGISMGVNYGANKVRFPTPVPVDSRIRAGVELVSVTPTAVGFQVVERVTIEVDGFDKPACVADTVSLLME